jgi:glycosyltransferase involved in cell wall biosynthesis
MKVSLIATVLNADEHIGAFLASIAAQTRVPDEVIVVDGGSTDGTAERLRAAEGITVIEEPGANIARGRNLAIAAASHDVLAVADADCTYAPGWLAALLEPFAVGADVSMGWTEPVVGSLLGACVSSLGFPLSAEDMDASTFMPSARSVAFRREAIDAVGGYPEWLAIGEDMWVNHRWRERAFEMRMAPNAIARWHPRASLGEIWRQYVRYAKGDGQGGMYPERHALRFVTYGALLAALASRRTWPKLLAAGGAGAYARAPVLRTHARLTMPRDRAIATAAVPLLLAFTDIAKMVGYGLGLADRLTGRVGPARGQ